MKQGKTLQDLAVEIERQYKTKKDYVTPTSKMMYDCINDSLVLPTVGDFKMSDLAETQIANRLEIPVKYYRKCKAHLPTLLAENVNGWLNKEQESLLVRTLDGKVRAVLSNKYRALDNFDLAQTVLPIIANDKMEVVSCEVNENNLFIKATTQRLTAQISKGDVVQMGICISNSEVGLGALKVAPMIYRLVCTNGMIADDGALRKYHIGRNQEYDEKLYEYYSNETRRTDDKAFWLKVRDIVTNAMSDLMFQNLVKKMQNATREIIDAKPTDVVEVVTERFQLQESESDDVLTHLIKGNDLSKWGLVNAVTRASQECAEYERATDLEKVGGQILELSGKGWETIARAVK